MEVEEKIGAKEILSRLAVLQADVRYVRGHIEDITLTKDDFESIDEAKNDLKERKTRRL